MIPKERIQECTATILQCNLEQVNKIAQVISFRREQLADNLKRELKEGDKVTIISSKGTENGTIIEVKRTRAIVNIDEKRWDVPLKLITKQTNND